MSLPLDALHAEASSLLGDYYGIGVSHRLLKSAFTNGLPFFKAQNPFAQPIATPNKAIVVTLAAFDPRNQLAFDAPPSSSTFYLTQLEAAFDVALASGETLKSIEVTYARIELSLTEDLTIDGPAFKASTPAKGTWTETYTNPALSQLLAAQNLSDPDLSAIIVRLQASIDNTLPDLLAASFQFPAVTRILRTVTLRTPLEFAFGKEHVYVYSKELAFDAPRCLTSAFASSEALLAMAAAKASRVRPSKDNPNPLLVLHVPRTVLLDYSADTIAPAVSDSGREYVLAVFLEWSYVVRLRKASVAVMVDKLLRFILNLAADADAALQAGVKIGCDWIKSPLAQAHGDAALSAEVAILLDPQHNTLVCVVTNAAVDVHLTAYTPLAMPLDKIIDIVDPDTADQIRQGMASRMVSGLNMTLLDLSDLLPGWLATSAAIDSCESHFENRSAIYALDLDNIPWKAPKRLASRKASKVSARREGGTDPFGV